MNDQFQHCLSLFLSIIGDAEIRLSLDPGHCMPNIIELKDNLIVTYSPSHDKQCRLTPIYTIFKLMTSLNSNTSSFPSINMIVTTTKSKLSCSLINV